ncbi:MAG TPA: ABC transporter permease [Steroidobacteraceae bacterium]|jgi:ABC-type polysaccharide/polyol phosphate export permease|nr:ABC transporter permease [Steroidobacteraceae bacterium]
MQHLKTLYRSRELLYLLTWRDIRVRYKQSVMGLLWAILMPLLIVGAGAMVRIGAAKWSGVAIKPEDMASVVVRAVIWAFFISAIRFGTNSLIGNATLVTKIAFPKEVFPIAAVLSSLFDFAVATVVVAIALPIIGIVPTVTALWFIPLLFFMIVQATGLAMILSATNLFFRDVKYIVEVFLTYAIFFTPVLYPASALGSWEKIVLLNPIAPLLEAMSNAIVDGRAPDPFWTTYSAVASLLFLFLGYTVFKKLEADFAESI